LVFVQEKNQPDWPAQTLKQGEIDDSHSLAARLDLEMVRIRAGTG